MLLGVCIILSGMVCWVVGLVGMVGANATENGFYCHGYSLSVGIVLLSVVLGGICSCLIDMERWM